MLFRTTASFCCFTLHRRGHDAVERSPACPTHLKLHKDTALSTIPYHQIVFCGQDYLEVPQEPQSKVLTTKLWLLQHLLKYRRHLQYGGGGRTLSKKAPEMQSKTKLHKKGQRSLRQEEQPPLL